MHGCSDPKNPDRILEIGYAFWKSKALHSAVELGLFTALGDGALDGATLAGRLRLHQRGASDFFDALVALDLLHRDADGRYANSADCAHFLDRRSPNYIGGMFDLLGARIYPNWASLTEALRSGAPPRGTIADGGYAALYADKSKLALFLNGMTGGSLLPAKALAASFPWHAYRTMIDIGTAQGCLPVEIARAHPHLGGGGFDLPQLKPAFTRYVHEHGLDARLQFYGGDFLTDPLPRADVLIMGRILHNWDLPTKKLLLTKAFQALPDGGALIVYETLIDDDRREAQHALLASLNMLIETPGGFEYSGADCMDWMHDCGFRQTRIEPFTGRHTAVVGIKRGG
jgi:hypothetical protein